jgi:hypothetical protein
MNAKRGLILVSVILLIVVFFFSVFAFWSINNSSGEKGLFKQITGLSVAPQKLIGFTILSSNCIFTREESEKIFQESLIDYYADSYISVLSYDEIMDVKEFLENNLIWQLADCNEKGERSGEEINEILKKSTELGVGIFPRDLNQECNIIKAYWSTNKVKRGKSVELVVLGNGCDGDRINLKIYEYDVIRASIVDENVASSVFSNGKAVAVWNAEWELDIITNPEYYFVADSSVKSDLLSVEECLDADIDCDGKVSMLEMNKYIKKWKSLEVTKQDVDFSSDIWKKGGEYQ